MAKIFVRERGQVKKGDGLPRFAVVGVEGSDLKFFQVHLRKSELDTIAQSVGAEVVELPQQEREGRRRGVGSGKRQKKNKRQGKTKGNALTA